MAGRRKFFRNFSAEWKWFDFVLLALGIIVPVVLGVIFDSSILETITSILFITAMLIIAKAKIQGFFVALVAYVLYIIVSFNKGLYGEVIAMSLFTIPITILTIVLWLGKGNHATTQIKGVQFKGFALLVLSQLIMGIGYYFLLRAFNTNFLIVSTITLAISVMGDFLCARKNVLGPYFYVIFDICVIILWSLVVASGHPSAVVIIAMQAMNMVNDLYGAINWTRLSRKRIPKSHI